jgi:hypothetical protein
MRPWKIVLSGVAAASGVALALLRAGLSGAPPDAIGPLLLPRLPALALVLIAVYALVAILLSAAALITPALRLRRELGRTDASSQAAAALDWIAGFDSTALRGLVPRLVGALPESRAQGATILLGSRFDRRVARAEVAHLYYVWLARSYCLAAFVGLAAVAALGFAQSQGGVPFLSGDIPAAAAVVVLVGLLLLAVLARCAIDVTIDPLIDAMSRLPWESIDTGRLRRAVDLLEKAGSGAVVGGRVAEMPPERVALALEEGNRALSAASDKLSAAAEAIGLMTRSAIDGILTTFRDGAPAPPEDGGEARIVALQAAIEGLSAELRRNASAEPLAAILDRDRRALADAVERLSIAAEAIDGTRSAMDGLDATLREMAASSRQGNRESGVAAAAESAALQTAVKALTAELHHLAALVGAAADASADGGPGRTTATAEIGRELRRLLEDIKSRRG